MEIHLLVRFYVVGEKESFRKFYHFLSEGRIQCGKKFQGRIFLKIEDI
jgi:hypothetical protein